MGCGYICVSTRERMGLETRRGTPASPAVCPVPSVCAGKGKDRKKGAVLAHTKTHVCPPADLGYHPPGSAVLRILD
jgi:hypothetical protein